MGTLWFRVFFPVCVTEIISDECLPKDYIIVSSCGLNLVLRSLQFFFFPRMSLMCFKSTKQEFMLRIFYDLRHPCFMILSWHSLNSPRAWWDQIKASHPPVQHFLQSSLLAAGFRWSPGNYPVIHQGKASLFYPSQFRCKISNGNNQIDIKFELINPNSHLCFIITRISAHLVHWRIILKMYVFHQHHTNLLWLAEIVVA